MFDFLLGSKESINDDPWRWLLAIKRMLPRWINGVPDSEFRALYDLLMQLEADGLQPKDDSTVLVETGCGASTIMLLYFALRWNTKHYTWDISSNKLAELRAILTDTLFRHFSDRNIYRHWVYAAFSSTSEHAGLTTLSELNKSVCACFLDSEHTWATLGSELTRLQPLFIDGAVVAIDDGNYNYMRYNTAYINMIRAKLELPSIDIQDNEGQPFWVMSENLLKKHFGTVMNQEGGTYRREYPQDIFYAYYSLEREATADLAMEKVEELAHRFDAWRVYYE